MDAVSLLNSFIDLGLGNPLVQSAVVGAVRSFIGWAENALQDGQINRFELKQLFSTMLRILPQSLGLGALFGAIGAPAASGAVSSLFTDMLFTKFGKKKK